MLRCLNNYMCIFIVSKLYRDGVVFILCPFNAGTEGGAFKCRRDIWRKKTRRWKSSKLTALFRMYRFYLMQHIEWKTSKRYALVKNVSKMISDVVIGRSYGLTQTFLEPNLPNFNAIIAKSNIIDLLQCWRWSFGSKSSTQIVRYSFGCTGLNYL